MNRTRISSAPVAALLLLGGCGDAPTEPSSDVVALQAHGSSHKATSFVSFMTVAGAAPPSVMWTGRGTPGTVLHQRASTPFGTLAGDLEGTFTSTWNTELVQKGAVLSGPARGKATFTLTELFGEPVNGAFELRAQGRVVVGPTGVTHTGRYQGQGTGDLRGMKISGTYELTGPGAFDLQGHILVP